MASAFPPIQNMNLTYAISDIYYSQKGGLFQNNYLHLIEELQQLHKTRGLDESYLDNVVEPFINYLLFQLPEDRFNHILSTHSEDLEDPEDKRIQSILPVLAEALLQRNYQNRYYKSAFEDLLAFQAIVDTIFDIAIKNNTSATMPPLVAWSRKRKGPFTFTAEKISEVIQIPIGIVCLPPEYRNGGLFAWSVMGHEVAGHNFIQTKPNFLNELASAIENSLAGKLKSQLEREGTQFDPEHVTCLSQYWSMPQRVEEVASDVLGILSTGPSLAIGCIGYFRGMSQDKSLEISGPFEAKKKRSILHIQAKEIDLQINNFSEKLEIKELKGVIGMTPQGEEIHYTAYKIPSSPHPVALLRPLAMIGAIKQTKLEKPLKLGWVKLISDELKSQELLNTSSIKLIKTNIQDFPPQETVIEIPLKIACLAAEIVGNIICTTKFRSLGQRKICEIFNWSTEDEANVDDIRQSLQQGGPLPGGVSASHIVAAAVMEASSAEADIETLFQRMKKYLNEVRRKV